MIGVHTARREPLRVEPEVADDVAGEPGRVGLVVDRELPGVAEHVTVGPQDPHARRVERRHPHGAHDRPDEDGDAFAHLGRGLVGERDRQDLRRLDALVDQVGDAVREHPCLAGTGTRHHQQRTVLVHDGVELVGVEAGRERRRPASATPNGPSSGSSTSTWSFGSASGRSAGCGMSPKSSSSVTGTVAGHGGVHGTSILRRGLEGCHRPGGHRTVLRPG